MQLSIQHSPSASELCVRVTAYSIQPPNLKMHPSTFLLAILTPECTLQQLKDNELNQVQMLYTWSSKNLKTTSMQFVCTTMDLLYGSIPLKTEVRTHCYDSKQHSCHSFA